MSNVQVVAALGFTALKSMVCILFQARVLLGHWTLEIGYWTLDIGHWILDIGHWILDIGHWTLDISPILHLRRYRSDNAAWEE